MRNFWQGQQLGQGRATTRTAEQARAGKKGNTKVFQGESEFIEVHDNVRGKALTRRGCVHLHWELR